MLILAFPEGTSPDTLKETALALSRMGLSSRGLPESAPRLLSVEGGLERLDELAALPGVSSVHENAPPHPLASQLFRKGRTQVKVKREGFPSVTFGGPEVPVIAGPCSVESWEQLLASAQAARKAGARLLRGGAYKPRSSPYSFQGLGREGLELLARARDETGLLVVTEVLDKATLEDVAHHTDVLQIGTRNMSNFPLLRAVGRSDKPVLLKRGFSSTLEEWLLAAEYILAEGNEDVILCERGVRTFGDHARFVLDLNIIPAVKGLSHLPVIADPSHSTGRADCVEPLARAAVAVGVDGVMLEIHPRPEEALSDGPQALTPGKLDALLKQLDAIAATLSRSLLPSPAAGPGAQSSGTE